MVMNPNDPIHQRIDELVKNNNAILFMKGDKQFPKCGFSAGTVEILNDLGVDFESYDILLDPEVRSGAKTYSDWPTFPQLYVAQEFIGGADIVREMYASGELADLFGVEMEEIPEPKITITDAAAQVLRAAAEDEEHEGLRLEVSSRFQYNLLFAAERAGDFKVAANGFTVLVDRSSAKRSDGLILGYSHDRGGFTIDNPHEPPSVKQNTVRELQAALQDDPKLRVYDVRSLEEFSESTIPHCRLLTDELREELMALDKDTELWFVCRSGNRSNGVASAFLNAGFTNVHNVHGGLMSWEEQIGPGVCGTV